MTNQDKEKAAEMIFDGCLKIAASGMIIWALIQMLHFFIEKLL
jgi:hypothetical protein